MGFKKFHNFVFLIFLMTIAFSNKAAEKNKKFVISYVDHQSIINYYVPLLNKAYRSIGIVPEFVMISDKRALMLLNSGQIEADTAKSTEVLANYPNIIKVPTPISKIHVTLVCQLDIKCDLSILNDHKKILGVIGAAEFYQKQLENAKINIIELTSFDVLLKIFQQDKVDVILMVFDDYSKKTEQSFTNRKVLEEKLGYHLLNKKHRQLVPKIEQAIKTILAQGDFTK